MRRGPFTRSALILLLTCGLALFALSVLLPAYDDGTPDRGDTARAGTYSVSAIGHAGVYDMLRRLDFPVSRGRGHTLDMVGGGTLMVIEPDPWRLDDELGPRLLMEVPSLVLVLPKWRGVPDKRHSGWVGEVRPESLDAARRVLSHVTGEGDVARVARPAAWTDNELGVVPALPEVVQVARSPALRPVVGTADGMLVGELIMDEGDDNTVWVLADPDVISNHGLGKGENTAFVLALLRRARGAEREAARAPLVFDESVHGFRAAERSGISWLFRFPYGIVTGLTGLSALLAFLAGAGRFGAPLAPGRAPDFGKARLIANGARLLDYAGHHDEVLRRYARRTVRAAARALQAPPGLEAEALTAWLDRVGAARGARDSCSDLMRRVANLKPGDPRSLPRLFACACAVHRWKGEITHGISSAPGRRR